MTYTEKRNALITYLDDLAVGDIALAFSGGVDSSLLLKMCADAVKKTGKIVHAVTFHTKLHPMNDLEIARKVAAEAGAVIPARSSDAGYAVAASDTASANYTGDASAASDAAEAYSTGGVVHHILCIDELEEAGIRSNPVDRCYLCKKCLFQKLIAKAEELGACAILDGTNADDLMVYRPGIRALRELGVISPLAELGITKEEVRQMAAEYGLSVSGRPSTPCMATRFPYGTELDYGMIRRVEEGEAWLRAQGFSNVRLRVHGAIARIEVDADSMAAMVSIRKDALRELSGYGFDYITLDLAGFRSGSMDLHLSHE